MEENVRPHSDSGSTAIVAVSESSNNVENSNELKISAIESTFRKITIV